MIIGKGDVANVLKDREGAIFFAAGVSDSMCEDRDEFRRERTLLLSLPKNLCLFYFGSISMYYKDSPYTRHKASMELAIKSNWVNYNIIRLGNITWGTNPKTFLNYLRRKKSLGEPIDFFDEYRYVVDEEQLLLLTNNLPLQGQNEINIFGRMAKPKDLI